MSYICPAQGAFNDIAVLVLERMVGPTDYIRSVCVYHAQPRYLYETVFKGYEVAGWGKTQSGRPTDYLQFLAMTGVPRETCQAAWSSKINLQSSQLCAEGEAGSQTCTGDSGGPLVTTVNDRVFLVAIISFGDNNCDSSKPVIFTRVENYYEWLVDVMFDPELLAGKAKSYGLSQNSYPCVHVTFW